MSKKNGENGDSPHATTLYRHFDADDQLLYVGISLTPLKRLISHSNYSHWYDLVVRVEMERFPTRDLALKAEREAISKEQPAHNLMRPSVKEVKSSRRGYEGSRDDLIKRIVQFNPTYEIANIASILQVDTGRIRTWMDEGKLGFIEIPKRRGWNSDPEKISYKRVVTGWHLIDFFEAIEGGLFK